MSLCIMIYGNLSLNYSGIKMKEECVCMCVCVFVFVCFRFSRRLTDWLGDETATSGAEE